MSFAAHVQAIARHANAYHRRTLSDVKVWWRCARVRVSPDRETPDHSVSRLAARASTTPARQMRVSARTLKAHLQRTMSIVVRRQEKESRQKAANRSNLMQQRHGMPSPANQRVQNVVIAIHAPRYATSWQHQTLVARVPCRYADGDWAQPARHARETTTPRTRRSTTLFIYGVNVVSAV